MSELEGLNPKQIADVHRMILANNLHQIEVLQFNVLEQLKLVDMPALDRLGRNLMQSQELLGEFFSG